MFKVIIDLDAPDMLPLHQWLLMLKRIRVQHEVDRHRNVTRALKRLGCSRFTIYRTLNYRAPAASALVSERLCAALDRKYRTPA